jgi:uncharacterized protein
MDAAAIIATLRDHQPVLAAMGIRHAGVFGSVARGEAGPESDIDILVEFEPGQPRDIYAYVGIQERVATLFSGRVDVVDRGALRPRLRGTVMRDPLDAF